MNAILFGGHPRTEWSAHTGVMPVLNDALLAKLKAQYDLVLKKFGYLQTLELTDYREPSAGITTTRFEDGTEVTVDSTKQELFVNGKNIDRPAALA
ncbi:MAG: DUF5696 domain-containing protein [Verrucomicrobiota bacterium]